MCESQPCWVTSTSGAELAQQRGYDGVEGAQPAGVGGAGRQRDVDRRALGARAAGVGREAGAGEEHLAGLVQGDREHPRVVPEDLLDAVAVVDVDVDVGDPLGAVGEQLLDADRDVVVDAEAARPVGHRVVQAAGDVDRVQRLAAPHLAERLEAGADDVGAGDVHVLEDRVVVGAEPVGGVLEAGRRAGPGDRVDQALVVHGGDLLVGGHGASTRLRPSSTPELLGQPHREVDADRGHRVGGPEVVLRERLVEDDRRRPGALHVADVTPACSPVRASDG